MRRLALYEKGTLYASDGSKIADVDSYKALVDTLFDKGLLCIIKSVAHPLVFPFLDQAVCDPRASVLCSKTGHATGIRFRYLNSTRWVIRAEVWGEEADIECLGVLERLFEYVGMGTFVTPSALGLSLQQRSWGDHNLRFHTTPNYAADRFVAIHISGGRVDTPGLHQSFDVAVLFDMVSAHLAKFAPQPTGTAILFSAGGLSSQFKDYFAHVEISVKTELALGPFPVRGKNKKLVYPTLPGRYEAFLWKDRIEACRMVGCEVKVLEGVGWREMTWDTHFWIEDMYRLRVNAPEDDVAQKCKISANAAVGRHGSNGHNYILVSEKDASDKDVSISELIEGHGVPLTYYVHEVVDPNPSTMIHWYSHTLDQTAGSLWMFALPFAEQGRLIATNYDGVITLEGDETKQYAELHTVDKIMTLPGTWIWEYLHHLHVKNPRSFIADEMVVMPGVRRDQR